MRLIFYVIFYSIGYDFWIFPNLTDDKLGVVDSFKPLYEIKKREDKWTTILIRVAVAIGIGAGTVYLYQNPELIDDFAIHLQEIYVDVLSWGNEKIIHYHNGTGISLVDKNDKYRRLIEEEDM